MKKAIVISPKRQLILKDLQSLAIGLGIALAGSALTYISEWVLKCDYGEMTPVIVAVWSVIANALRKLITETQYLK